MIKGKGKNGIGEYELHDRSMSDIPDYSVGTIIIDPPLNVGTEYGGMVDQQSIKSYVALMESVARECERVLYGGGNIIVQASDTIFTGGQYIELARLFQKIFTEVNFKLTCRHFVVIKNSDGIELPEQAGDWDNDCVAKVDTHSNILQLLEFTRHKKFNAVGDILYTNYIPTADHPCPFPIDLVQYLVDKCNWTNGKAILEPFMGSGRLGLEVVRRGGKYYGYENNPRIFAATSRSFAQC